MGWGEGDPVEQRESFTRAQEEAARSCCVREYGTAGTDPHHDTLQYQLSLITVITIIPEPNSRHNQPWTTLQAALPLTNRTKCLQTIVYYLRYQNRGNRTNLRTKTKIVKQIRKKVLFKYGN